MVVASPRLCPPPIKMLSIHIRPTLMSTATTSDSSSSSSSPYLTWKKRTFTVMGLRGLLGEPNYLWPVWCWSYCSDQQLEVGILHLLLPAIHRIPQGPPFSLRSVSAISKHWGENVDIPGLSNRVGLLRLEATLLDVNKWMKSPIFDSLTGRNPLLGQNLRLCRRRHAGEIAQF